VQLLTRNINMPSFLPCLKSTSTEGFLDKLTGREKGGWGGGSTPALPGIETSDPSPGSLQ
jgi:hypothetical protein